LKVSVLSTTRHLKGKSLIIFLIIWFLFSFSFIAISLTDIIRGQETESWPSTTGVIVSSYFDIQPGSEHATFGAKITYQYTLNGLNYTSNKISYGYSYSSRDAANYLLESYPVGKIITIYYSPLNPSEAILIRGIYGSAWIIFFGGLFFSLIGVVLVIYFRLKSKGGKSSKQINITLEKTNFVPGDTIEGTVHLSLKKQKYAKALKVAFIVNRDIEPLSQSEASPISCNIYRDEVTLDVEREYWNEIYPFRIKIPVDIFEKIEKLAAESAIGKQRVFLDWGANKGFGNYIEKNTWYVRATLDMSKKLDISNKVEINVSNVS
jgi:hypothetical protein